MGSLGFPELIIILIIIIMIFGANRLPEIGRGIGKGIRNFKEATREGGQARRVASSAPPVASTGATTARFWNRPPAGSPALDPDTPAVE